MKVKWVVETVHVTVLQSVFQLILLLSDNQILQKYMKTVKTCTSWPNVTDDWACLYEISVFWFSY